MTPDGLHPLPSKQYYDIVTWLTTQAMFSFTVMPFILLTLPDSILLWRRVYFYAIIQVALSLAFFASPAKGWLVRTQRARVKKHEERVASAKAANEAARPPLNRENTHIKGGMLGLPDDIGQDIDEIVNEVMTEMERKRQLEAVNQVKSS